MPPKFDWKAYYAEKKADPKLGPLIELAEKRLEIANKMWDAAQASDIDAFTDADMGLDGLFESERLVERKRVLERTQRLRDRVVTDVVKELTNGINQQVTRTESYNPDVLYNWGPFGLSTGRRLVEAMVDSVFFQLEVQAKSELAEEDKEE